MASRQTGGKLEVEKKRFPVCSSGKRVLRSIFMVRMDVVQRKHIFTRL